MSEHLTFTGGGYRKLKTFILGRVIYDVTARFATLLIPVTSRTRDQMAQAARSVVQNIAEGSAASVTSKETELRLTNVARASLEELTLDYEDFLRQNRLQKWDKEHPLSVDFIARKVKSNKDFHAFSDAASLAFPRSPKCEIVANAVLLLIEVERYLLSRLIERQSRDFLQQGGFRERMSRFRRKCRDEEK